MRRANSALRTYGAAENCPFFGSFLSIEHRRATKGPNCFPSRSRSRSRSRSCPSRGQAKGSPFSIGRACAFERVRRRVNLSPPPPPLSALALRGPILSARWSSYAPLICICKLTQWFGFNFWLVGSASRIAGESVRVLLFFLLFRRPFVFILFPSLRSRGGDFSKALPGMGYSDPCHIPCDSLNGDAARHH